MIESHVEVPTKYGRQPCFAVCPDAPGQFPPVIIYMDAPGTREELRDHARRIAKHGYFCLLPDLYYRLGTIRFDIPRRNEAMSGVIRASMLSLTITGGDGRHRRACSRGSTGQEKVKPGPAGCVGHCMSGPFALAAASRYPRMKAAAALYGVDMVTDAPDSPHLGVPDVKGELYIGFAEHDPAVAAARGADAQVRAGATRARGTSWRPLPARITASCSRCVPTSIRSRRKRRWDKLFALWDRNLK